MWKDGNGRGEGEMGGGVRECEGRGEKEGEEGNGWNASGPDQVGEEIDAPS